jgi:Fe(3+) dicitrate transport protein
LRQFNAGSVDVYGLEVAADYEMRLSASRTMPSFVTYTLTSATFRSSFDSDFGPWGHVDAGDEMPYVPEHQLSAGTGVETPRYGAYVTVRYSGAMRTAPGQGHPQPAASTDKHAVVDVSVRYEVAYGMSLLASVMNVTDVVYVAARRPAGVRPGLPRRVHFGIAAKL